LIILRLSTRNATFLLLPIFSAAILGWSQTTAQYLNRVRTTPLTPQKYISPQNFNLGVKNTEFLISDFESVETVV
jgi:hypothetical protein